MFATLTSKGQLTLPKEIRDRLNLDAGAVLDFRLQADNTITARHVKPDARRLRGLLKSPHPTALSVEQMDEAVAKHLRGKHPAGRKRGGPMIGIDTNILLRLWLDDDPQQSKRIDALLAEHGGAPGSLLVTDVVLAEAVWTLKAAFEQDKRAQLLAVRSLLEETAFAFEDREAVVQAVAHFEAPGACGFADCLVVAKHAQQGCEFTATFDRGMRKLPGVRVL